MYCVCVCVQVKGFNPLKKKTIHFCAHTCIVTLSLVSRWKHWGSYSCIMHVNNFAVMYSDTDLAGGCSEELLFFLQVLSFGCQSLLLCVLLTPQVAGQIQRVTHCYTYVTRSTKTQVQS